MSSSTIIYWRSPSRGGPPTPTIHKAQFDQAGASNKATLTCSPLLLAEQDGKRTAPEWVPLLPAGDVVLARDGRSFRNDHAAVIAAFLSNKMSIPLDWDHALDSWNMQPGDGRAAAWIDKLEVREGGLWGHVEVWTARGRDSIESLEYRYLSPVVFYDDNRKLVMVPRASLVNNPALMLPALCRQEYSSMNPELLKLLLAGLGIDPQNASEAEVKAAVELYSRGKGGVSPSLETHIPRAQYDVLALELAAAKDSLSKLEVDTKKARIDAVLKDALSAGRMLPAERPFFEKMAAAPGGLDDVQKFLDSRPVIAGAAPKPAPLPGSSGGGSGTDALGLTAEERAVCDKGGVSYQAYAEQKKRQQKS